jgi:hypothetical protein
MVSYAKAKAAVERLYEGVCTVYAGQKAKNAETGETEFAEAAILTDQPCRLSFASIPGTDTVGHAPRLGQAAKLFVSPGVSIPPGSRIAVTQNGVAGQYSMSGEPARYATHQEIPVELFKGWA